MATARRLHNLQGTQTLTISTSGTLTNAQGYLMVTDQTDVEWDNTSTTEYDIVFTIGNFATITVPGRSISSYVSASGEAVNYVIKEHATGRQTGGPYCIQWGNGVLGVSVSATSAAFTIAVPAYSAMGTGYIQFTSDGEYDVGWTNAAGQTVTVWSQQSNGATIYPTPPGGSNPNPVMGALPGATTPVTCTFAAAPNVPGKGGVHIGG